MRYGISSVARMTNLSADVIRVWERRYNIVEPQRDSGGLRTYSEDDVLRLKLARSARELGHPIRRIAALNTRDLQKLVEDAQPRGLDKDAIVERIMQAVRDHDASLAQHIVASAAVLLPPANLALEVLAPVLRTVGEEWERGRLTVWQEHLLSAIIRSATATLPRPAPAGEPIIFATPPFEMHEFGITLAAMLASARGRTAITLGTGVPAEEVADAAKRLRASVVVIALTRGSLPVDSAAGYVRALDSALPAKSEIWIGGSLAPQIAGGRSQRIRAVPTLEEFMRLSEMWP